MPRILPWSKKPSSSTAAPAPAPAPAPIPPPRTRTSSPAPKRPRRSTPTTHNPDRVRDPSSISPLHSGDEAFRMVADEFLKTAEQLTQSVHKAEYQHLQLNRLPAATRAVSDGARIPAAALARKKGALLRERQEKERVRKEEEEEEDEGWEKEESVLDVMLGCREREMRLGDVGRGKRGRVVNTRAAAGFREAGTRPRKEGGMESWGEMRERMEARREKERAENKRAGLVDVKKEPRAIKEEPERKRPVEETVERKKERIQPPPPQTKAPVKQEKVVKKKESETESSDEDFLDFITKPAAKPKTPYMGRSALKRLQEEEEAARKILQEQEEVARKRREDPSVLFLNSLKKY